MMALRAAAARTAQTSKIYSIRCFSASAARNQVNAWRKPLAAGAAGLAFYSSPCLADGASKDGVPTFTMDAPKYDQSSFYGRLMGMYDYIDPRTLLLTSDDLKKSQAALEEYKKTGKKPQGLSDAEMWQHRKNVEVSIHPVTGDELLKVGRMSAFVPMNVPLCAFMLMANGTPQVLAAQWLNQTYNMVNNYVNRSGATVEWDALLKSYALAVTASCSIAVGAGRLLKAVPSLQVMGPFDWIIGLGNDTSLRAYISNHESKNNIFLFASENGCNESKHLKSLVDTVRSQFSPSPEWAYPSETCQGIIAVDGIGSSHGFHCHDPVWNTQVQGTKHWWLLEPHYGSTVEDEMGFMEWGGAPKPANSKESYEYPNACAMLKEVEPPVGVIKCITKPGEMLILPDSWMHATCGLTEYTIAAGGWLGGEGREPPPKSE